MLPGNKQVTHHRELSNCKPTQGGFHDLIAVVTDTRTSTTFISIPNTPLSNGTASIGCCQEEFPVRDFPAGYGPGSTAAVGAKPPTVTTLRYTGPTAVDRRGSMSGEDGTELLVCGCDDGAVTVRPARAAGVYARVQAHDSDSSVAAATCSCDGEWIVSGDSDGLLAVHRLRKEPFEVRTGEGRRGASFYSQLPRD